LEQEPSTRQNIDSRLLLTYLNQDMLAENEMDVQQYKEQGNKSRWLKYVWIQETLPF
jgi:hypothetical protein